MGPHNATCDGEHGTLTFALMHVQAKDGRNADALAKKEATSTQCTYGIGVCTTAHSLQYQKKSDAQDKAI